MSTCHRATTWRWSNPRRWSLGDGLCLPGGEKAGKPVVAGGPPGGGPRLPPAEGDAPAKPGELQVEGSPEVVYASPGGEIWAVEPPPEEVDAAGEHLHWVVQDASWYHTGR